jgi:signal transduction histidine kinase
VDRTLVVRALTNLIENAVQAMPLGGALDIRLEAADSGVRLVVRDTGIGMDANARQRAFEPYFSTKTAGSGLGLANAKRNIEREGGTIALESAPDQGTTITVTLPSAPPRDALGSG